MSLTNRITSTIPYAWAVFISIFINGMFTVEWSHPYCNKQDDGPGHAAFGFPLPYTEWAGASSMEYAFMPYAYLLNLAITGFLAFFVIKTFIKRKTVTINSILQYGLSIAGVTLAASMVFIEMLKFFSVYAVFVTALGDGTYNQAYFSYRPVGVSSIHYDCKPSEFWFGPILH
ncbi:MAG: hypothetical protein OEZ39_16420 [Gammaproteobacteria bacterium]|nr:hypothetical protein [Gammaproteobacteria bacterium]MDH5653445.1 hypothetical protein [Gammaproteobacteria bacterium]